MPVMSLKAVMVRAVATGDYNFCFVIYICKHLILLLCVCLFYQTIHMAIIIPVYQLGWSRFPCYTKTLLKCMFT